MRTTATRQHSVLETNESPEIRPVDPDNLWLHGTRAPCFDTPRPATCFTRDPFIAASFSLTGSYQAPRSQHGERRVLSATIDLPEGAPIMRMSLEFDQYLAMVDSTKVFCPADQEDRAKQQRERCGRRITRQPQSKHVSSDTAHTLPTSTTPTRKPRASRWTPAQ